MNQWGSAVVRGELSARYTLLSEVAPRADAVAGCPLPLDAKLKRKMGWNSIACAF